METLGYNHICEVESHFYSIFSSKKYKKTFIIGDLNLESIDWSTSTTSNRIQCSYLNLFTDLALIQLITEPTHISGNTLDILLTDYPELINNIKVFPPGIFISSDHSPISLYIQSFIKGSKPKKRNIFNFKRAN